MNTMTLHARTDTAVAVESIQDPLELGRRIEAQITQLACGRIRDLQVTCSEGRVTLRGRTSTYYAKQLAQQAALDAATHESQLANLIVVS